MESQLPATNQALRQALYSGRIFRLEPNRASGELVAKVRLTLQEAFRPLEPQQACREWDNEALLHRLSALRAQLAQTHWADLQAIATSLGFLPFDLAIDRLRLRALVPDAHHIPAAAPAYFAHRDTWYANPQAQLNWWIPLFDYPASQTFAFYPSLFSHPVPNDSRDFDYCQWKALVGWQNPQAPKGAAYPSAQEPLAAPRQTFACRAGEILLFAAAHLHQPQANTGQGIRFSLDFRTVHLEDHASGRGAPNVDNFSTGCALEDYWRP